MQYNNTILLHPKEGDIIIQKSQMSIGFIKTYLKEIKKHISKDNFTVANREKNKNFMREYGLDMIDLKEVLLSLTPEDCISDCESDRDGYPGMVYKFKSEYIEELVIYIKTRYNPPDEVVLISFHEDEL